MLAGKSAGRTGLMIESSQTFFPFSRIPRPPADGMLFYIFFSSRTRNVEEMRRDRREDAVAGTGEKQEQRGKGGLVETVADQKIARVRLPFPRCRVDEQPHHSQCNMHGVISGTFGNNFPIMLSTERLPAITERLT